VASGVGAILDAESIPVDPNLSAINMSPEQRIGMALNGGEDFELLFTVSKEKNVPADLAGITRIGEITANVAIIQVTHQGNTTELPPAGYRHF
jgi:thiamine-monophosphate kinase